MKRQMKAIKILGPAAVLFAAVGMTGPGLQARAETSQSETPVAAETRPVRQTEEGQIGEGEGQADQWLPIGSVVKVKDQDRSFMILGRRAEKEGDVVYDYCACLYPDGFMGEDLLFINRDQVDQVLAKGFEDEYERYFRVTKLEGEEADGTVRPEPGQGGPETSRDEPETSRDEPETSRDEPETSRDEPDETAAEIAQTETEIIDTYVTLENVHLRAEPSTDSAIIVTVPGNRLVDEDPSRKRSGDWIPVIFTDSSGENLKGYIRKDFLK